MVGMPRPRPPHLHRQVTRHGKVVWYFRREKGPRTRIEGEYGTPQFLAAYEAVARGDAPASPTKTKPSSASLAWLIDRYRESSAWGGFSNATRRQRENIFKHVIESAGLANYGAIDRKAIVAGRERRKETPAQANNFIKAMRGLFQWAVDADLVEDDPTRDVKWLKVRSEGFRVWTDEEVAQFEARWPVGTRERVALDVLLYTGLRRGDAVKLGRQHVKDGMFRIKTEKTGVEVHAPVLPELAATLRAGPTGTLAFIATLDGQPMKKESFGNWFRVACKAAGVPGSAHGLRKAGATRAANNGATTAQLEAIFGWSGGQMAALYTRRADRTKLAKDAISALGRDTGSEHPIPSPRSKVRE
jgi:integrase